MKFIPKGTRKAVLNLGYAGNGPLIEYATLREYLEPNVKNILWIYYEGNDIANLNRELNEKALYKRPQTLEKYLRFHKQGKTAEDDRKFHFRANPEEKLNYN